MKNWCLITDRLKIEIATASDKNINLLFSLWTDPQIMTFVGFPRGLQITKEDIKTQLQKEFQNEFDRVLTVKVKDSESLIGQCKLGFPNNDKIAQTDIKLLPKFHRNGYGTEIKRELINYLFDNTDCKAVEGTPNKNNIASIKMQEAVGGVRVAEKCHKFPEHMKDYTIDVPHYIYYVYRNDNKD